MKILLFITGYRQLEEYNYFNKFLQKLKILNDICDIFIYCNNTNISSKIVEYYKNFSQTNKYLFITSLNAGYRMGGVEAVSNGIEMGIFNKYDYIIHLHPDVFITDDEYLMNILYDNIKNDTVFLVTKSLPNDKKFFSFDFFILKPNLLKENIFIKELYTYQDSPEHYLCDMIEKYHIQYSFVKRFNNNTWCPRRIDDNLKLYHEHDLKKVVDILAS